GSDRSRGAGRGRQAGLDMDGFRKRRVRRSLPSSAPGGGAGDSGGEAREGWGMGGRRNGRGAGDERVPGNLDRLIIDVIRRPRESGDPGAADRAPWPWIPACAGTTDFIA